MRCILLCSSGAVVLASAALAWAGEADPPVYVSRQYTVFIGDLRSEVTSRASTAFLGDLRSEASTRPFTAFEGDLRSEFASREVTWTADPALAYCAPDSNGDGFINSVDLNVLLGAFGCMVGQPCFKASVDADFDCVITSVDLNLLLANFGDDCTAP